MTDPDLPVGPPPEASEIEELASAILDGEATPEELARASEPAVAAALASYRRVSALLASSGPVDEVGRERSIAAAIDAWGTGDAAAAPGGGDELAQRRARQPAWARPAFGAAAAVVVALVLGGLAVLAGQDDGDDVAASNAADDDAAQRGSPAGATAESGADSFAVGIDLGTFDDLDALVAAADRTAAQQRSVLLDESAQAEEGDGEATSEAAPPASPAAGAGVDASEGAGGACSPPPLPPGVVVVTGTATFEGRAVVVTVIDGSEGTVVQVQDVATCAVVYEGPPG